MKSSHIIRNELHQFQECELIFASKLYKEKLHSMMNEATFYKTLERLYKKGELAKASKGVYYIPENTKYGQLPPSEKQIIDTFTQNNTGTVIGYALYNSLHLTTQVPKTIHVLSAVVDSYSKKIQNIEIKKVNLTYDKEVIETIHGLEVLQNFYNIEDLNIAAFLNYFQNFSKQYNEQTLEYVLSQITYKKSTLSFLKEILNYYETPNNLDKYLSSLSTYKHPKMEDLYESTSTFY